MLESKLYVITFKGYIDMLKNAVTTEDCKAVLFNPEDYNYFLNGDVLYYKGNALNEEEVFEYCANPKINKSIKEALLIYGIFSFIYTTQDLRNKDTFQISLCELSRYLKVSMGQKGYRLNEKLKSLSEVYGLVSGVGVFKLLEAREQGNTIIIQSQYLHIAFNNMLNDAFNEYGERVKWYTNRVYSSIVSERNVAAGLVVIEIVSLTARAKGGRAHISIKNLVSRIPQLIKICLSENSTGAKNKYLRRVFNTVNKILDSKTSLYDELKDLKVAVPNINILDIDSVVDISYTGFHREIK